MSAHCVPGIMPDISNEQSRRSSYTYETCIQKKEGDFQKIQPTNEDRITNHDEYFGVNTHTAMV
jgi:hypothetical protein